MDLKLVIHKHINTGAARGRQHRLGSLRHVLYLGEGNQQATAAPASIHQSCMKGQGMQQHDTNEHNTRLHANDLALHAKVTTAFSLNCCETGKSAERCLPRKPVVGATYMCLPHRG